MTDKPLDCAGTTGPVGKHDFRAAPRPDIVRPGADSCAPVAPVVDGMPGEIWIGDIEGSHCRCWNGPTYGGFHGEGHISTKYVRADLVKDGAE